MHYLYLGLAILAETIGTSALKLSDGFSKPGPAAFSVVMFVIALFLMSLTLRVMPVGVVYAIWSGLGIVFISAIGWIAFGQSLDIWALVGIGFIISGILILNVLSGSATL